MVCLMVRRHGRRHLQPLQEQGNEFLSPPVPKCPALFLVPARIRACAVPDVFREEHRPCSAENSEKAGGSATVVAGLRECTPACTMCDAHCAAPGPLLQDPPPSMSTKNPIKKPCSVASTTREYRHGVPARVVIVTATPHLMTYLPAATEPQDWLAKRI